MNTLKKGTKLLSLIILMTAAVVSLALQMKLLGWILLTVGFCITLFDEEKFKKEIMLLYLAIVLLSVAQISTAVTLHNYVFMGLPLLAALVLPYIIGKYKYKSDVIQFNFKREKRWQTKEFLYILFTTSIMYLGLPFLLRITGSYHNWTVEPGPAYLFFFFIAINIVGMYDEIFFMGTVLKILRRHFPFLIANIAQSVIFTSFLYELGFRGIFFLGVFLFAFLQGIVFKRTNSLFYLITIHLTADFILYLALIHAYYPLLMPIFLVK